MQTRKKIVVESKEVVKSEEHLPRELLKNTIHETHKSSIIMGRKKHIQFK